MVKPGHVHLQGVGDLPGTLVRDLKSGDTLMWNYGSKATVAEIRNVSAQFVEIIEQWTNKHTGKVERTPRRLKKDRLVVRIEN